MQIVTLLAHPDRADLTAAVADPIRARWGGGDLRWLDEGLAAEFGVETVPGDFWRVWQALQTQGFDIAVQPEEGRRKRVLLADMDSTMIGQECIDELAAEAGAGEFVASITARAMNGELDFEAALRERVALLKGLPAEAIAKVLAERITFASGGRKLVGTMKANGGYAVLVSGGFTAFTEAVAAYLGFDEDHANTLQVEGGRLAGTVAEPILGREAKVARLSEVCDRLGIPEDAVIAVGDGANDLAMLHRAGTGVALHAKPSVAAQCDIRVNHGDLTALLYLQGYAGEEFIAAP
ncbi:phosphoserine phosphatase SerB [Acidimangrovimonas sediminis]|uniref:phosphoserine phosphatase SerB n=1 Tax=Acidimangrovimonas sediminis TaxID=2056283 RepID=UPI000C80ED9C|nr:phosphoserine phosphatase SerB [Acidimangrovimonas sediminis]